MNEQNSAYDKLPPQMRAAPRWLLWKAVPHDDPAKKPRKVPYYADGSPRRGALDSPEDISRLASFDNAQQACESGAYTGLGFALGLDGEGYWQGVDLDNLSEHIELCAMLPDLPGYQENSPSKKGMHAIGYGRKFDSLGSNESGIEAYSSGRYFTVTADISNNLPLTCLADFVEGRLRPMHGVKWGCNATSSNNPAVIEEAATAEIIKDLRNALLSMPSDDRQLWVKMGLALKSLPGDDGRALWLEWSAKSSKHDPISDARTWEGFDPTRTDYKSVFAEAQRNGWVNPKSGGATLLDLASVFSAGASLPAGACPVGAAEASTLRYKLLSDDDLCKLPPMQWRIKKVLPQTGLAAIYGASSSGKSFLVLDALQVLAAGREWFGYKTKPCNVLYCVLEGEGGIAGRVAAYRIRHSATSSNIRYLVQPFSLLENGDIHDLAQAIKTNRQGADVVVLDTLNRAVPGADENDSKSMGQIIAASKQLQTLVGGLVVLVHHTGKDASKGLRGHSSLHAALDAAIEVRRDGDSREWIIAKSKDGEDGEAHPFKLDVVELGIDEDGEPITSCTVHPLEDVADNVKKILPPKSGNQRVIWDALGELFRQAGNVKPEGAPGTLPHGRPCLTIETAIDKTRTRLVCDQKRQTERTQAAIAGLVARGLLFHEGGFVWRS